MEDTIRKPENRKWSVIFVFVFCWGVAVIFAGIYSQPKPLLAQGIIIALEYKEVEVRLRSFYPPILDREFRWTAKVAFGKNEATHIFPASHRMTLRTGDFVKVEYTNLGRINITAVR